MNQSTDRTMFLMVGMIVLLGAGIAAVVLFLRAPQQSAADGTSSRITPLPTTAPASSSDTVAITPAQREQQTLASIKKIDAHPLYSMTYYGDYDRMAGVKVATTGRKPWGCSLFTATADPEQAIYGRNFDWDYNPAMLLFTDPSDGYASVSMVDISYLGIDHKAVKANDTLAGRKELLRAPLLPFDGMNEHGLTVGMAAVDPDTAPREAGKPTVGSLRIIRIMLDKAKTTDEALKLMQDYNIDFVGGPPIHYLIADPSGHSAVVEFTDGQMHIIRNDRPWLTAMNFYLNDADEGERQRDWRYAAASKRLSDVNGAMTWQESMDLLKQVAQGDTQWSIVYSMSTGDVHLAMSRQFANVYHYQLTPFNQDTARTP